LKEERDRRKGLKQGFKIGFNFHALIKTKRKGTERVKKTVRRTGTERVKVSFKKGSKLSQLKAR